MVSGVSTRSPSSIAVGISDRNVDIATCGAFLFLAFVLWLASIILLGQMEQIRLLALAGGKS